MTPIHRLLIPLLSCALAANAEQLEWRAAIAANTATNSTLTSIEALSDPDPQIPAEAFACGFFEGDFNMGPGGQLDNGSGRDGMVIRFTDNSGWDVDWKAHAESSGDVFLNDIVIAPGGDLFVCGTYKDDVQFIGSGLSFSMIGGPHGFVARLDKGSGTWIDAYQTNGIEPVSLVAGPLNEIILTGPGTLAALYSPAGAQQWSATVPPGTTEWAHIAIGPTNDDAYVMTKRPHGSSQDISLTRIDLNNSGSTLWTRIMGSNGPDFTGGLDVANDGDVRLSFTADHPSPRFNGITVPDSPLGVAIHTIMVRVRPNGAANWLVPVGFAQSAGSMTTNDLDCDAYGNAWVAAKFTGAWEIEGQIETGVNDAALIAVDGTGLLYDFHRSTGSADEKPLAVAAPTHVLGMITGEYSGNGSTFPRDSSNLTLNNTANGQAFFAVADPIPGQTLYVFRPTGPTPPTLQALINIINQEGGQVYAIVDNQLTGIAVSAWVTNTQLSDIDGSPGVDSEIESDLATNSSKSDGGWALGRLNDPTTGSTSPYPFTCPDTAGEVVVYLIDTAIDDLGGWFSTNTNLTIEGSILIRGSGDPTRSSAFEHGTQMLSLIAGPEAGGASGTPIRLINFDIYPTGSTTTSALLADAILEAVSDRTSNYPCNPGIICIASSSTSIASSSSLSTALSIATSSGLSVVLSGGNAGEDASLYVPQQYAGSGILCVGASDITNTTWADSNYGTPIDLYAPGEGVRTVLYTSPSPSSFDSIDGTSASAALTTAVGIIHLSINPWQTPIELEAEILANAKSGAISSTYSLAQLDALGPSFSSSFDDWASWHSLSLIDTSEDSDGDGLTDGMEYFLGLNPCASDAPSRTSFSFDGTTSEFSFTLNGALYDSSNPTTLLDGTTWEVESSSTLSSWSTASGTFSYESPQSSRIRTTLSDTPTDTACYLRLEVTHAP